MKIGIISDTHNNHANIQKVVKTLKDEGISIVIHCGDMVDPDDVWYFDGFRLIYLFGNMDIATGTLRDTILPLRPDNYVDYIFDGVIDGVNIAAVHGDALGQVDELAQSGKYSYVFCGHTHRRQDEKVGSTRVINPGALGGLHEEHRSICILNLITGDIWFINISD